jgi:dGTPase
LIYEVNRRLITEMVRDLVSETSARLARLKPKTVEDIRLAGFPVAAFSDEMASELAELREFLFDEFYYHPRITGVMADAQKVVRDLYNHFLAHPESLPEIWREEAENGEKGRVIGDFVAGMTDRLAIDTHRGLFDDTPRLR